MIVLREGTLRAPDPSKPGHYLQAAPHDPMYSALSLIATEWWNGKEWVAIYEDDNESSPEK